MTDQEIQTKEGGILECIEVDIKEIKTSPPPILDQNSLLRNLCSYQAGKRDTIINILNFLKEKKMVSATKDIKLTPKGENYLEILESNFGQYLDTNYIKTLNNNMSLIEKGRINDKEFLNYWWFSLRSFLQTHTEEEKVLQWKRN
jgi:DNA topoisomerase IA